MTQIHCDYVDCENNETNMCHAIAIKLSTTDCCLTYQPPGKDSKRSAPDKGDQLLWDKEYFEDDPLDDQSAY